MKFVYGYKTSQNERREGIIRAASKEDAYTKLKAQGIRPFSVTLAPGVINSILSLGKRGFAILALGVLSVVLVTVIIRDRRNAESDTGAVARHQIYGDPASIAWMEDGGFENVFSTPGERYLAHYAQPGRGVTIPRSLATSGPQGLRSCLTNVISVCAEDPREVVELKRIVMWLKDELREYLSEGTVEEFVHCLAQRQEEERSIYNRVVNELEGCADMHLWEERNKSLRELGLRTIPPPKTLLKLFSEKSK